MEVQKGLKQKNWITNERERVRLWVLGKKASCVCKKEPIRSFNRWVHTHLFTFFTTIISNPQKYYLFTGTTQRGGTDRFKSQDIKKFPFFANNAWETDNFKSTPLLFCFISNAYKQWQLQ